MVSSSGVKKLNLFDLPLTGRTLIEASAGTGKTYSLAFIYLRLLLGIGQNSYPEPLGVSNILVVTFTKAATQELRSRIRQNIHELRMGLLQGEHADPLYQQLIALISDRKKAIQTLTEAQQAMDEAAIYTIHSFCQRILTTHAFESGVLFEQTLVANEQQLRLQVVQEFWRLYFSKLDRTLAQLVLQSWQEPASLLKDITPHLNFTTAQSAERHFDLVAEMNNFYQDNLKKINAIKSEWQTVVDDIANVIVKSGVSKNSYSSKHLPNWIEKVSAWALSPTDNFTLPDALEKFRQTVLNSKTKEDKTPPLHPIFDKIEALCSTPLDLKSLLLTNIVGLIKQGIHQEKIKRGEMGFDDLLSQLNNALQCDHGDRLAQSIAKQYCVAMIDEFQDTDLIQYQIFDRIYRLENSKIETGLLFIGDPKQAIYSFRGADIFTYFQAKKSVEQNNFTMDVNWRSSLEMVTAVNRLFSNHENAFVYDEIPFLPMKAATKNEQKALMINQQKVAALSAYLLPEENTANDDYQDRIADCCAEQIVTWLSGLARLVDHPEQAEPRRVTSADIAILVRTHNEAKIIQQKLTLRGVKSVYLSDHNSVFASPEAKDILCLLQAVLMPESETTLRLALMTNIMGQTMSQLEQIVEDQDKWESLVEEFKQYQVIWYNYGLLPMLRRMIKRRHLAENILVQQYGERTLTNIMHLGELLQEVAYELDSPHALIRWLAKQVVNPDPNLENHEQRLESDENLVKIITIHKSKGLEFPLVWLPFVARYRASKSHFYHIKNDNGSYQQAYAAELNDELKKLVEQERLAEDLRLFYVAITRSIYHCSIGLATLAKNDSAINYLLKGELRSIADMANLIEVTLPIPTSIYVPEPSPSQSLSANVFRRKLANSWRVTSYSELQKQSGIVYFNSELDNEWDEYQLESEHKEAINQQYDIHHFPKGTHVGTLLHKIMEEVSPDNIVELCDDMVKKLNLEPEWSSVLSEWLPQVLATPLNSQGLSLSQVLYGRSINELQFHLPIRKPILSTQLDSLCKQYDVLSKLCPELDFETVQGMLKGFIDLVFEWQGKFYVVDYKSNWLGESADDYGQESLNKVMCEHRYELQYQLYTLALHRFLKSRLPNYQYSQHMGGVYYLFLRGMPTNGIFYHLPDEQFIEKLDQLFDSGE